MPLAPNQQLFEYRIVGVLGQGAFGIVCLHRGPSPMEYLIPTRRGVQSPATIDQTIGDN